MKRMMVMVQAAVAVGGAAGGRAEVVAIVAAVAAGEGGAEVVALVAVAVWCGASFPYAPNYRPRRRKNLFGHLALCLKTAGTVRDLCLNIPIK